MTIIQSNTMKYPKNWRHETLWSYAVERNRIAVGFSKIFHFWSSKNLRAWQLKNTPRQQTFNWICRNLKISIVIQASHYRQRATTLKGQNLIDFRSAYKCSIWRQPHNTGYRNPSFFKFRSVHRSNTMAMDPVKRIERMFESPYRGIHIKRSNLISEK